MANVTKETEQVIDKPNNVLAARPAGGVAKRDEHGHWLPEQSGNPLGRKPGYTGRTAALMRLDSVVSKASNLELLAKAFQAELERSPLTFYLTYIMPLLPKTAVLDAGGAGPLIKVIIGVNVEQV